VTIASCNPGEGILPNEGSCRNPLVVLAFRELDIFRNAEILNKGDLDLAVAHGKAVSLEMSVSTHHRFAMIPVGHGRRDGLCGLPQAAIMADMATAFCDQAATMQTCFRPRLRAEGVRGLGGSGGRSDAGARRCAVAAFGARTVTLEPAKARRLPFPGTPASPRRPGALWRDEFETVWWL
jgi:hypothetical protein